MFTSISRHNAHGRWVAGLVVAQILVVAMAHASDKQIDYSKLERSAVKALLASAVAKDESIPDDVPTRIKLFNSPIRASSENDGLVLVPFTVDYKKLANAYCRLAVLGHQKTNAIVLPIPSPSNHSNCLGYRTVFYEDINGDGVKDFIAEISIKSNRYDVLVSETVVYISNSASEGGFCYSADASKAITSIDLHSINGNRSSAIEKLRKFGVRCSQ